MEGREETKEVMNNNYPEKAPQSQIRATSHQSTSAGVRTEIALNGLEFEKR
jgi:hypothetical protein